jgi:hypothetical protein
MSPGSSPHETSSEPNADPGRGFHWLRWTAIGCAAWIAFMILTGASFTAIFLMPVAGPIGGWLVGGTLYLLGGLLGRR